MNCSLWSHELRASPRELPLIAALTPQTASDGNRDRGAGSGGVERLFHHAKDAADLGQRDDGLGFAVDRGDQVAVEVVDVGRRTGPIVLVEGDRVAGRHGLGDARRGLHREDVGFVPRLAIRDAGVLPPIGDEGASLLRLQVEARQGEEVVGTDLDKRADAALEGQHQFEAVVDLVGRDMGGFAIDLFDLLRDDLQDLVDQVHAPVEDHPAAVLLVAAPVARDAARAVDARFDIDRHADLAGIDDLLDRKEVDVPAAVLVNGEEFSRLFGGSRHPVKRFDRKRHRLFADDVVTAFKQPHHDILVHVVRGRDDADLGVLIRADLVKRSVDLDPAGLRQTVALLLDIVHAAQRDDVALQRVIGVPAALTSVSDHDHVFLHIVLLTPLAGIPRSKSVL